MSLPSYVYVAEKANGALAIGIAKDLEVEAFVDNAVEPLISFLLIEEFAGHGEAINRQVQLQSLSDEDLREFIKETNPSLKNVLIGFHAKGSEPPQGAQGAGDRSPLVPVRPRSGSVAEPIPKPEDIR